MSRTRTVAAAAARRLYRALLALHPLARRGYGPQMAATFDTLLGPAADRGVVSVAFVFAREAASLSASAWPAHKESQMANPANGTVKAKTHLVQDLRYALRSFRRRPGFTAALVATLALGIGANTAIFSIVNAVLFQRLPFADPSRLVMIWEEASTFGFPRNTPAPGSYSDWNTSIAALAGVAAIDRRDFNLVGDGDPEKIGGAGVTANLFSVLGVEPRLGRVWRADEDVPGNRVAVLGYNLWQRRFAGDSGVLTRRVEFNGIPYTVLGVMPPRFEVLTPDIEIFVPIGFSASQFQSRGDHYLSVIGRLASGVTLTEANVQLGALATRLQRDFPDTNKAIGMFAVPLLDDYVGDTRTVLIVLLAAVGCVLLIACANVANLLLTRASGRSREMAVRAALGADRSRLIQQLLTESLLVAAVGGALGVVLAQLSFGTLTHLVPAPLAALSVIGLDSRVLAATAGVTIITGVLFGLAPAWRISRSAPGATGPGRSTRGVVGGPTRLGSALVVAEIAMATVLLIGAGLMTASFRSVQHVELGFTPDNVVTLRVQLPRRAYADFDKRAALVDGVLERVRAMPAVASAGYTSAVPLVWKGGTSGFRPEGLPRDPQLPYDASNRVVSPGYMETIGIRLRAGRFFDAHDDANGQPVAIINESMARQYWPGRDPLGLRFKAGSEGPKPEWRTVVGLVADTCVMGIDQPTRAEMYFPIAQSQENWMWPRDLTVRTTTGDPMTLVADIRRAVWSVDHNQPVSDVKRLDEIVGIELQGRRLQMTLMIAFAGLALVLAAVGVYGVLSYSVTARTGEIALRLALGGDPSRIRWLVVRQGLGLSALGLAIGLLGAYWGSALLQQLLFRVAAHDLRTFAMQAVALAAVCFVAAYLPARRASRVDPITALRSD